MNNTTNSASVLDKFAEKIDFTKLEGKPEAFYKAGLAFVENGQFDDGIIEFVKIIKTVSHQESLFVDTVKELKGMGFSSADILATAGILEIGGEKELGVDSQIQTTADVVGNGNETSVNTNFFSIGFALLIILDLLLLFTLSDGYAYLNNLCPVTLGFLAATFASFFISKRNSNTIIVLIVVLIVATVVGFFLVAAVGGFYM